MKQQKINSVKIAKKVAREVNPLPSPKIFKTKKDYNRQRDRKIDLD